MGCYRLVILCTYDWRDEEETLLELYFHSTENAEKWIESNREKYQSFHYVIIPEDITEIYGIIEYEDEYWTENENDYEDE